MKNSYKPSLGMVVVTHETDNVSSFHCTRWERVAQIYVDDEEETTKVLNRRVLCPCDTRKFMVVDELIRVQYLIVLHIDDKWYLTNTNATQWLDKFQQLR